MSLAEQTGERPVSTVAEVMTAAGRDEAPARWRPGSVAYAVAFAGLHVACLSVFLVGVSARALAVMAVTYSVRCCFCTVCTGTTSLYVSGTCFWTSRRVVRVRLSGTVTGTVTFCCSSARM